MQLKHQAQQDHEEPEKIRFKHYVPEWCAWVERRHHEAGDSGFRMRKTDLATKTGASKSTVGRWFKGAYPEQFLPTIAAALGAPEPFALLVHPIEYHLLETFRAATAGASDDSKLKWVEGLRVMASPHIAAE